jgi:hypothetical protein
MSVRAKPDGPTSTVSPPLTRAGRMPNPGSDEAVAQGVNEHRSMMDSQSIITQHIERIEDALDSTITKNLDN